MNDLNKNKTFSDELFEVSFNFTRLEKNLLVLIHAMLEHTSYVSKTIYLSEENLKFGFNTSFAVKNTCLSLMDKLITFNNGDQIKCLASFKMENDRNDVELTISNQFMQIANTFS